MQIKKVTYYLDDKKNLLHKVVIDYVNNSQYENVVYVFNEQNVDYKKEDMSVPVQKLVFENGNTLKKKYEGFKLIDTRKK